MKNISTHECLPEHIQSEISRGLYLKNNQLDVELMHVANRQVAENREVLHCVIEVLIFAARQNIAIRGHDEKKTSSNCGNFIELLKLVGRSNAPLASHLNKISGNNHNRLTFMSHKTQDKLLSILGDMIRKTILISVKNAGIFAVIIDTTTDIANFEQFTLIVRFVNEKGKVEERLLALEVANDGTGRGLFNTFCLITKKYNIHWEHNLIAQAYDGAASMQGEYNGL